MCMQATVKSSQNTLRYFRYLLKSWKPFLKSKANKCCSKLVRETPQKSRVWMHDRKANKIVQWLLKGSKPWDGAWCGGRSRHGAVPPARILTSPPSIDRVSTLGLHEGITWLPEQNTSVLFICSTCLILMQTAGVPYIPKVIDFLLTLNYGIFKCVDCSYEVFVIYNETSTYGIPLFSIIVTQKEEDLLDIDLFVDLYRHSLRQMLHYSCLRETGMGISTLHRYQSHLR